MNDKTIIATIIGYDGFGQDKRNIKHKYSLGSVYKFINQTKMPTDIGFLIYDFLNPMEMINLEKMRQLIYEIEFNRDSRRIGKIDYTMPNKYPITIYEEKFEDPIFTGRLLTLLKDVGRFNMDGRNFCLSYINCKFTHNKSLYSLSMVIKANKDDLDNRFKLKFVIKDAYIGRQRKCNKIHDRHNFRLCKFLH